MRVFVVVETHGSGDLRGIRKVLLRCDLITVSVSFSYTPGLDGDNMKRLTCEYHTRSSTEGMAVWVRRI